MHVQLPMVPAMIAYGVTLFGDAADDVRPFIGMPPEDEEGRLHVASLQRVEDARSRIGIGTIVEGQRDVPAWASDLRDRPSEDVAVRVIDAVNDRGRRAANRQRRDHARMRTPPRTLWYTS